MPEEVIKIDANTKIKITRYNSGKLKSKIPYRKPKGITWLGHTLNGLEIMWYESGRKSEERKWKEGKEHGVVSWWHENGERWWEATWRHSKKHGLTTRWLESGERRKEIYYIAGKESARIEWDEEGNVTEVKVSIPSINAILNPQITEKPKKITSKHS